MRSISFGSGAAAIANQTTGGPIEILGRNTAPSSDSEQHSRAEPPLYVMLEGADTEVLDLVRGRTRRLGQCAVETAAEHPAQQREPVGRERPAATARARPADGSALFEIERDEVVVGAGV